MDITDRDRRSEATAGLRALADWLDEHTELPLPFRLESPSTEVPAVRLSIGIFSVYDDETGAFSDVAVDFAEAVKALGGHRRKDPDDGYFRVTREFSPGVALEVWALRDEVCEAVVVGTTEVAVEKVITPAVTEIVIEEQDVIEWRCAPVTAPEAVSA